jgi:hypothetical protein
MAFLSGQPLVPFSQTTIAGLPIPSSNPVFLTLLAIHVPAGLVCVIAGAVAMLSEKGSRRHIRAGTIYYRSLTVVFATMSVLAVMRWTHSYHLFVIGLLSFSAAVAARRLITHPGPWSVRGHIICMGSSYVLLLVAFYVDNGRSLPLWKDLPTFMYWLLPIAVGLPLIVRAVATHELARAERDRRPTRRDAST